MLEALFDKDCNLVGWIKQGEYIFESDMNWMAYISGSHP